MPCFMSVLMQAYGWGKKREKDGQSEKISAKRMWENYAKNKVVCESPHDAFMGMR